MIAMYWLSWKKKVLVYSLLRLCPVLRHSVPHAMKTELVMTGWIAVLFSSEKLSPGEEIAGARVKNLENTIQQAIDAQAICQVAQAAQVCDIADP